MKKLILIGGIAAVAAAGAIWWFTRPAPVVEKPKAVVETGPDPAHLAKVAELARSIEDLEQKGKFEEALATVKKLAALEPKDPRIAPFTARLEEKVGRLKAWRAAHDRATAAKDDAVRRKTAADWQKVVEICAEAEKSAPTEEQLQPTRELAALARQNIHWLNALDEEKKGNLTAALDLAGRAIAEREAPPELTAYKASIEKKIRKKDFDRVASQALNEPLAAKAYELWKQAKGLADDPKDVEEADRRLDALLPRIDMAERDRRFDAALKAGDAALAAGRLDEAEKSFKAAKALNGTDLKPGQGLSKVETLRKAKAYEDAMTAAKAAEDKKEWTDAVEACDRALRMKPGDPAASSKRKQIEDLWRPAEFTIVLEPNTGIKMTFVRIPRGSYKMGDARGRTDEAVRDAAIAKEFYMQTTEVTQRQWEFVMRTRPFTFTSVPDLPAESVSWADVQKFLEKLNGAAGEQMKGRRATLPTEQEWEYACRAGTTSRFSFGDDEGQLEDFAWFTRNAAKGPQPVGKKRPNAWGLFDMHGNVSEWCSDVYAADPAKAGPATDETPRSIRGGSWNDRATSCRSGNREKDLPTKGSMAVGFRAVLR